MPLKVSEILGSFIQVCVQYFASPVTISQEQDLQNRNIELMDENSRTMHSHSSCYRIFTLPGCAIDAAFSLAFKFCVFNKLR